MIYDFTSLKIKYNNYSNLYQKVRLEKNKENLFRIKKGLYTDDILVDAPVVANIAYGSSYISFEYALSYYGLIPEHVSMFTSAVYNKKNNKIIRTSQVSFEYRSIPEKAFQYGQTYLKNEDGVRYKIASKEKALLDMLYTRKGIRSINELKITMFDDLRIDEEIFYSLDFDFINELIPLYHSNTLLTLKKYIKEVLNK